MSFDYVSALKERMKYPLLGGNSRYIENGIHKEGDMWVNHILEEQPDSALIILPIATLMTMRYQKMRNELFSIYGINALVEVSNFSGNGIVSVVFLYIDKRQSEKVKIATFEGKAISKKATYPEKVTELFERVRTISEFGEEDIRILQSMPEPEYSDDFFAFMESIRKWIDEDTDEIDTNGFHTEVDQKLINIDRLRPFYYTEEALEFFKYIQKETFVPLKDVADVLRPFDGMEKMPETYKVKSLSAAQFDYPLDYNSLKQRTPMRKVRMLQKGDIVVSTIHADGKMRLYLLNEEPKEDITTNPNNAIIRAKSVSPEYLFLYLQSKTADKYVFYNSPFLQISLSVIKEIPIAIPSEEMENMSKLTFQASHPMNGLVPVEEINDMLRKDTHIDISDRPFQSVMLEELIGNIKIEKRNLIEELISSDADEMTKCFEAGAYKSCLILCGSILETVLLDWLSEIESTNYFVDDTNMQINLYGVIRRLKELYNPEWNAEARKAHDVRLKRNLVHPVKCVVERPDVSRDTCLRVFEELRDILISRGIDTNLNVGE